MIADNAWTILFKFKLGYDRLRCVFSCILQVVHLISSDEEGKVLKRETGISSDEENVQPIRSRRQDVSVRAKSVREG